MAPKKEPSGISTPAEKPARRPRRHGYRGYGSGFARGTESYGGAIHVGSGFAGVGTIEAPPTIAPILRDRR